MRRRSTPARIKVAPRQIARKRKKFPVSIPSRRRLKRPHISEVIVWQQAEKLGNLSRAMVDFEKYFHTSGGKQQFSISDPFGLRQAIQPVVTILDDDDALYGLGACFQVSPWGWLTAQHIIFDQYRNRFPDNEMRAVGFSPGVIFGSPKMKAADFFAPIAQVCDFGPPLSTSVIPGPKTPMLVDCAALRVNLDRLKVKRMVSPLPLSSTPPKIGDEVLAIGFPILGTDLSGESPRRIFEEEMVGAAGIVTDLYPDGRGPTRSWPSFEIEGEWKSGMSGGPVIDKRGLVVGVVSSSVEPNGSTPGVAYAVDISAIDLSPVLPELDRSDPGWCYAAGLFRNGKLLGAHPNKEAAELAAARGDEIRPIRINPKTEDWSDQFDR